MQFVIEYYLAGQSGPVDIRLDQHVVRALIDDSLIEVHRRRGRCRPSIRCCAVRRKIRTFIFRRAKRSKGRADRAGAKAVNALFCGLGSGGTVSANKNSIKIIGDKTQGYAQGYFVYDSRKSGAVTVSHSRFGKQKIRSSYLIGNGEAGFIACHQPVFLERYRMLDKAAPGSVFLLNSSHPVDRVWATLPRSMQAAIIAKNIAFYTIDAYAIAKFAAGGKSTPKKDLARLAIDYEQVYVAQVAYGAKDTQTLRAFLEAESYPGTSLIIAYSPCIAHGVDLSNNLRQQDMAVRSGHWPLLRYDPRRARDGNNPLQLDSQKPSMLFRDYALTEARFSLLSRAHPEDSERFLYQPDVDLDNQQVTSQLQWSRSADSQLRGRLSKRRCTNPACSSVPII